MNVMDSEVRITPGKACEILGVHPNTLRRWANSGKLAHIRLPGGERRYLISDLEAFQREHKKSVH